MSIEGREPVSDWMDAYLAGGEFLPDVPAKLRAAIDAAGEVVAYASGYADCAGWAVEHSAEQLRAEWWKGYEAALRDMSERREQCWPPSARRRPLPGPRRRR